MKNKSAKARRFWRRKPPEAAEKENRPVWTDFEAKKGKIRKSGTGGIYQINDHLYEGRYPPTNAQGKREAHNVYAKTKEECEALLEKMIKEVRARIKKEKEKKVL